MSKCTSIENQVAGHVRALPPSGIREFFELVQGRPEVISLGVGEPNFTTPWHIREAAIFALERGKTSYTSNLGLLKLREAISRYVAQHFGPAYHPEQEILVTVGVSEALDLALRALINPGDEIIYHEPCYVSYSPSIALAHGVAVPVACRAEEKFSVTAAALAEAITPRSKVLVLNFPTNPTGGTMTRGELQAIADLAARHALLTPRSESEQQRPATTATTSPSDLPDLRERTIFLHGFSKAYAMTGFRIGYACGPAELVSAMTRIHQYSMLCASLPSQEAALEALRNGNAPMAEMREAYRQRRNVMVSALNAMGLECHLPRGSFYAFPSVQHMGLDSKSFASKLLEAENVAAVPGNAFGESGEGFLRCCFAAGLEQIETAMERMARFVTNTKKG